MAYEDFDYGTEEDVKAGGGNFKNPKVGTHNAVLRSIIHLGLFRETYQGDVKAPAPQVCAIFELKGKEDFEEDGETPLTISKQFPLKKGDKAFMTKFLKALDPSGKAKGFGDVIAAPCQVEVKAGKEKNEDGTPKYVNFGEISGIPEDTLDLLQEAGKLDLKVEGVGHVSFPDLTKEAILELHPIRDVANCLMKGEKFANSKAEEIIAEIRKDNADFAKPKAKSDEGKEKGSEKKEAPKSDLDDEEEF